MGKIEQREVAPTCPPWVAPRGGYGRNRPDWDEHSGAARPGSSGSRMVFKLRFPYTALISAVVQWSRMVIKLGFPYTALISAVVQFSSGGSNSCDKTVTRTALPNFPPSPSYWVNVTE
jgi:hypothetical protein